MFADRVQDDAVQCARRAEACARIFNMVDHPEPNGRDAGAVSDALFVEKLAQMLGPVVATDHQLRSGNGECRSKNFGCYSLPRDAATIPTITTAKTASPTNSATVESMPNTVPPDGPAGPAGP